MVEIGLSNFKNGNCCSMSSYAMARGRRVAGRGDVGAIVYVSDTERDRSQLDDPITSWHSPNKTNRLAMLRVIQ